MTAPSNGVSVLAALTAEIMSSKKVEARKLTPIADVAAPLTGTRMPHDIGMFMSNEALFDHAKNLRRFAEDAIAIADGLDVMIAKPSTELERAPEKAAVLKAKEAEGDRKAEERAFAADFEAKSKAAQDATFAPVVKIEPDGAWKCPNHDKAGVNKTSAKGNPFIGCPDCNEFMR